MSSAKLYSDAVEDYIKDLVDLAAPDYEMWRPYFEFDICKMVELVRSDQQFEQSLGQNTVLDLVRRFLDDSIPLWVREEILSRVCKMYHDDADDVAGHFLEGVLEFTNYGGLSYLPKHAETMVQMREKSELVSTVFEGALDGKDTA